MPRFRTLTARFGTLYASLIAIVAGVCAVFLMHLTLIGTDSERVMEETREQAVLMRALSGIDSVQALLASPQSVDASDVRRTRTLLRGSVDELQGLEDHPDDPSRPEHQDAEARLSGRLVGDLRRVIGLLGEAPDEGGLAAAMELLASAEHSADVLQAEAQEEAQKANRDLKRRAETMRLVIVATLVAASLLLGLALTLVHLGVVRPLRLLRDGAEHFGRGELRHRIRVENTDEIADLANSLNGMADRLLDAQEHLEERVRSRTREFLRAARLADLGVLASGIAHEINTPLASIASCAEGLERRHRDGRLTDELLTDYSATICREVFRARSITTRMLSLVRQEPSTLSRISLRMVLEQAESALRHRAERHGVSLDVRAPEADVELRVNGGELVQILVNLLANALDASPPGTRVALRSRVEADQVVLTVEDCGVGIPEADLDRIFEPFYTTKPPGEGTGLGLALVGTMVESHRGHVSVESELGKGSVFRVSLPLDWGFPS